MSVIDRLKRLSGEIKTEAAKNSRQMQIGELRQRIEMIMARRPTTVTATQQKILPGKSIALTDLITGEELNNASGNFFFIPGYFDGSSYHGGKCIKDLSQIDMKAAAVIANDPVVEHFDFADGLFLDTETTGLSGGTGTLAFLIGMGWFEGDNFITQQIFARDFSEERASLVFLQDIVKNKKFLITFNGKAFDVGLLSTRFILNRLENPLSSLAHMDLLHPSRRLFGHRLINNRLMSLEEAVIGFNRQDDLPGSEIPQRYFDWLKRRDARLMIDVFEHNRLDVISMAALTCHLTELLKHPADMESADNSDLLYAARLFHDRGHLPEARKRLVPLSYSKNRAVKAESLKLLSLIHKRAGQWEEAVDIWEIMIQNDPGNSFALIELAKWCEHRAHNLYRAKILVKRAIDSTQTEKEKESLLHRLDRLQRYNHDNS